MSLRNFVPKEYWCIAGVISNTIGCMVNTVPYTTHAEVKTEVRKAGTHRYKTQGGDLLVAMVTTNPHDMYHCGSHELGLRDGSSSRDTLFVVCVTVQETC